MRSYGNWIVEDTREAFSEALQLWRCRDNLGDGGRAGMILWLKAAIHAQAQELSELDVPFMNPGLALVRALFDCENGEVNAALRPARRKSRYSPYAVDLKASCLVAINVLMHHGATKNKACKIVAANIRSVASAAGLRLGNPRKGTRDEDVIANWERDLRKRKQCKSRSRLAQRVDEFRAHIEELGYFKAHGMSQKETEGAVNEILGLAETVHLLLAPGDEEVFALLRKRCNIQSRRDGRKGEVPAMAVQRA